jgi:beta-galactosidase
VRLFSARLRNGNPNSHAPEKGNKVRIYNGLAQVILQSQRAGSGGLVLRATSAGLKPAETTIQVRAAPALPAAPTMAAQPGFKPLAPKDVDR